MFEKKEFFTPNRYEFAALMEGVTLRFDGIDLGLALLNMSFSPSGRYFAAGYHERGSGETLGGPRSAELQ